jgi:hypothetical protein
MTDLYHPRKEAQRAKFYPHNATIKQSVGDPASDDETNFEFEDVLVGKACKVVQNPGGKTGDFQNEALARDSVLFQECWPAIKPGHKLVVTLAGVEKCFDILDVMHIARETQTFATLQAR